MSLSNCNEHQGPMGFYLATTCKGCGEHRACIEIEMFYADHQSMVEHHCASCLRKLADSIDAVERSEGGIDPPAVEA